MVEREKERSLELRLERLQQQQSQSQSQLRQLNVVDLSSNTHPIQHSHSPRGVRSNLVSTPARSQNTTRATTGTTTADTSIVNESRNYNTHNTSRGMNSLNDFTVTPMKGTAEKMMGKEKDGLSTSRTTLSTNAKYSPSMILRKENFEKAPDDIHPR
ncbi:hypothetical protein LSM04_004497 [Trypanosoma melophagium]|uniref:uncharacterized protein n=1 Tax=Trypanosoma melophagium TaxID=715481 RepID=UPI00351A821F|nr:hypothetical protein LSM04_004497 [Trypanosoma melophagium]